MARKGENEVRSRENTRARLHVAAAEVFLEKGFEGARIDDVVRVAGFTRGAFYSNYSSMEELLRDVLIERSGRILNAVEEAFARFEGTPDVSSVMALLEEFADDGREMYILAAEYNLYVMRHPALADSFPAAEKSRVEQAVAHILEMVLSRMGREVIMPSVLVARAVTTLYLDSFSPGNVLDSHSAAFRQVVEAVMYAFSKPIEGDEATWAQTFGLENACGELAPGQ